MRLRTVREMSDLALVKTSHGLVPATEADRDLIAKVKLGQTLHGDFKKMRNPAFHRKFFALLDLAFDYWNPTGGLVTRQELRGIHGLQKYFENISGKPGQLSEAVSEYIAELESSRADQFPQVERSREAFRDWITIEAGHCTLVHTPSGVRRERKSISWAKMDDLEFQALYKDVFATCWRFVLSSVFDSEDEAMSAAERLGDFG